MWLKKKLIFIQIIWTSILLGILFILPLVILLTWSGPNIDVGTVFLSDFKCIAHNETDLYTCEIIVLNAMHWCENAYPSKCNF